MSNKPAERCDCGHPEAAHDKTNAEYPIGPWLCMVNGCRCAGYLPASVVQGHGLAIRIGGRQIDSPPTGTAEAMAACVAASHEADGATEPIA